MKKFVFATLLLLLLAVSIASSQLTSCGDTCNGNSANTPTLNIADCTVKINDRTVVSDATVLKAFERGQNLDISVEFTSFQDAQDVQVMAFITGYRRGNKFMDQIFDITPTFLVDANVSYQKDLSLKLPDDLQLTSGDELKVRIEISDKFSSSFVREYNLKVDAPQDNILIQDILLDPADSVQAGRGVFASVRLKNMGANEEDSIKITSSIPAIGLRAVQYVDKLNPDESTTSEDMFLKIPSCTTPGNYTVEADVSYADGDSDIVKDTTIQITADPECQAPTNGNGNTGSTSDKTVVTVPGKQDVIIGTAGTVYPIIIQNSGFTDRSYQLTASGLDSWATYRFDPGALVLLKAGDSQTVYLYVTPKADAPVGERVFVATVQTDGDQKQIPLTANVVEGQTQSPSAVGSLNLGNLGSGLIIGIVILVVLVVILGIVVGFNKMKGSEDEPEQSGQTYY